MRMRVVFFYRPCIVDAKKKRYKAKKKKIQGKEKRYKAKEKKVRKKQKIVKSLHMSKKVVILSP